jgi:hypothetical protein
MPKWIEPDDGCEEGQSENVESLLSQISPDIENRDMQDVLLLVKGAGSSRNSLNLRLDLWGQTLYIASRQEPKPEGFDQWMNNAIYLAWQQLSYRLNQLNLDPGLVNEPREAIVEVYGSSSILYNEHKREAFRISQLYYYYSLLNIDKANEEEIDNARSYTIGLGMQAVGFAYSAGCYQESITLAGSVFEVNEQMDIKRWSELQPEDICRDLENTLYLVCYNASKSAVEIRKFSEALDWLRRAEPYVSSLEKAQMRSSYHVKRGEVLIELGKGEEALTWYKNAVRVPGLTTGEVKDAERHLELAIHTITGDSLILFQGALNLSNAKDIETLKQLIESATTGNLKPEGISKMAGMLERALSPNSLKQLVQNTALKELPLELAKFRRRLIVLFARAAMQSGNFSKLEKLIPEIEQLAGSDSPAQLDAAFFLVRFRQYQGKPVTWGSISPLVSRLFDLPQTLILNYLLDLSSILVQLGDQELPKASSTIADLLKQITFDSEDERTPAAVVQQTAFSMDIIDSFLTLLVAMAKSVPRNPGWWLKQVSRFKYLSGYRAQRLQKESKLFRFTSELPEDSRRIKTLAESLTRDSFDTKGKGNAESEAKELELMTLLYPLYRTFRPSQKDIEPDTLYPEIIHIETDTFYDMEDRESPVINVAYGDGNWGAYVPGVEIYKSYVPRYLKLLETTGALGLEDKVMIEIGLMLRKALLPIPQHKGLFSLTGLRSTGVYHKIPLDSLPLLVEEETGKVSHWVGEQITSVLLTGQNKDLSILEKPLSINNIKIFANSTFKYPLRSLPGVVKEIGAIEETVRTATNVSLELYRESDSNRETFLRLSGKNAPQVLHIATHGIVSEESPSTSFIALSDKNSEGDSTLGAVGYFDIMLMDLRQCDLVVLSACSTHEGKSIIGEGIMGLAWAFKAAGAKAVIGTRWPVPDAAAASFWRKFYENVCNGRPIGEAFQGARMHIMKQEKWNHPFYWGVFQLIV